MTQQELAKQLEPLGYTPCEVIHLSKCPTKRTWYGKRLFERDRLLNSLRLGLEAHKRDNPDDPEVPWLEEAITKLEVTPKSAPIYSWEVDFEGIVYSGKSTRDQVIFALHISC